MTESEEIRLTIAKLKGIDPGITEPDDNGNFRQKYKYPNWPESIAEAWELFEEVKQAGDECSIGWDSEIKLWDASIYHYGDVESEFKAFEAGEDIAPLAMSKAYIPWKQWKQSQVPEPSIEVMYNYE